MKTQKEVVLFRFHNNGAIVPQSVEIAEIGLRRGKGIILMSEPPEGLEEEPEEFQDDAKTEEADNEQD